MINTNNNHEYLTADTSLAAYLVSEGFNLLIIQYATAPSGREQGTFVFDGSDPKLQTCVNLYNRGNAKVNLALYEHARSSLLDRVKRGLP